MTIQQAIKKALEAGWQQPEPCEVEGIEVYHKGDTFLDPEFWKCLGKAMGWNRHSWIGIRSPSCEWCDIYRNGTYNVFGYYSKSGRTPRIPRYCIEWKNVWHRFIDHIAEGKSIEDFFKNL